MYRLQTLLGGSRRLVGDNPRFLSGLSLLSGIQELLLNLGAELGDWLLLSGGLGQSPWGPCGPCWARLVDAKEVLALEPPSWQRKAPRGRFDGKSPTVL